MAQLPHPKPGDFIFDVAAEAACRIKGQIGSPAPMHFVVLTMAADRSLAFAGNYQRAEDLRLILEHALALLNAGERAEYPDLRPAQEE